MHYRQLFYISSLLIALLVLNSCSTLQQLNEQVNKPQPKPLAHKAGQPKFMKDVTLGNKGGNKINMDVGNKYETITKQEIVEETPNEEIVSTMPVEPAKTKEDSIKNNVAIGNYKAPLAKKEKHKKHKRNKHTDEDEEAAETPDIDKEPLVNVVPTHNRDSLPNYINHVSNREPVKIKVIDAQSCQLKYAGVLCSIPQALSNIPLYTFIDEWYGVDYRMGGNDKNGIDCSAFVQRLYLEVFGFSMVRTAYEQFNNCTMTWDINKLKEGDLVFFKIHSKHVTHVGVYLMNNYFVHASVSQGVVISNLSDPYWTRYFAGAGQILEDFAPMH